MTTEQPILVEEETHEGISQKKYSFPWFSVVACVLAFAAWIVLMYTSGYAAMGVAAMSIIFGVCGLRGCNTLVKNFTIAAIISSAVLLVVLTAFLIVIEVVLG